jgi:hypothetical protein
VPQRPNRWFARRSKTADRAPSFGDSHRGRAFDGGYAVIIAGLSTAALPVAVCDSKIS